MEEHILEYNLDGKQVSLVVSADRATGEFDVIILDDRGFYQEIDEVDFDRAADIELFIKQELGLYREEE